MQIVRSTCLALVLCCGAAAQAPPDFSGQWLAVEPVSVAGHELLITQDDATLTLMQSRLYSGQVFNIYGKPEGHEKGDLELTTYRLDGKPVITSRAADDPQPVRSSLRWERNRLVLIDFYQGIGLRVERTLGFDRKGRLVLERRRPVAASYLPPVHHSLGVSEPRRIVFEKRR